MRLEPAFSFSVTFISASRLLTELERTFVGLLKHYHYANMSVQYSAIFHGCKNDNFQMKIFDIFQMFAKNIDCEYPQSMFWSKNKKKYVYPCKPQFYYIKVGCKGVYITWTCFHDEMYKKC